MPTPSPSQNASVSGVAAFWFIIPLRGKAASKDWARVCALLRDTLRSALNQSDPDFRILLACSDLPDLAEVSDDRIEILQAAFPAPRSLLEQSYDKQAKKRLAAAEAGRRGGGYIMLLDSDDFVSRRIVAHVRASRHAHGFYLPTGFEYFAQQHILRPLRRFHTLCGSSYVLNLAPSQLPKTMDDPAVTIFDRFTNHRLVVETARDQGMDLAPLPFPGAVYLRENGENHSVQVKQTRQRRWLSRYRLQIMAQRLARQVRLFRGKVTPALATEFALPQR